jgi:soluble lytic murein transglycosylase-like protein
VAVLLGAAVSCWIHASAAFHVPAGLLVAIAEVESGHRPDAVAVARNGTRSVGLMQINSSWFAALRQRGIAEERLFDPCVNVQVGAWILSQNVGRYGMTWEAIGAYYAGPYDERSQRWKLPLYREYAQKVLSTWTRQRARRGAQSDVAVVLRR